MPIRWRLTIFNALVIGAYSWRSAVHSFSCCARHCSSALKKLLVRELSPLPRNQQGEGLDEEDGRLVLDEGLKEGLTHDGVFIVVRNGRGNIITQDRKPLQQRGGAR